MAAPPAPAPPGSVPGPFSAAATGPVAFVGVPAPPAPGVTAQPPLAMVPPTSTLPLAPGTLVLVPGLIIPGQPFLARGTGCTPGAPVTLTAGSETLPSTTADDTGSFTERISLSDESVATPQIVARCGPTLSASLSILVGTAVSSPTTSLSLLSFFVLIVGVVLRRPLMGR